MDNYELIEKWLSVFGKGVNKKMIVDHVTSYGNFLWHLFTWGNVACIEGDEARNAFDVFPPKGYLALYTDEVLLKFFIS